MCARASARRASVPLHDCRTCCGDARHVSRRWFSGGGRRPARGNGLEHEATIVGAFPVIAGALVQRAKGSDAIAPDATLATPRYAQNAAWPKGGAARGHRAGCLFRHRVRSRHERSTFTTRVVASTQADLFAAVTAGYCALTGRCMRRAGAGAGDAGCDLHARAHQALVDSALARANG